jgi:hypothetical protein
LKISKLDPSHEEGVSSEEGGDEKERKGRKGGNHATVVDLVRQVASKKVNNHLGKRQDRMFDAKGKQ